MTNPVFCGIIIMHVPCYFGGDIMHIEKYKSNGKDALRLVRTVRVRDAEGRSVNRKQIVRTFGLLSKYDDGQPDYLQRLRKSFQDGEPLIPELREYVDDAPKEKWNVTFTAGSGYCVSNPKRFAPCLLDHVFSMLGLDALFASVRHASGIRYDLQGIIRLLIYGRILDPASKIATMRQNELFYVPPVKNACENNVYDALTVLNDNYRQVIRRMNTGVAKKLGRKMSTVFYDVTNFFFEVEEPDEDYIDESGNFVTGLRKMGVSKENRKQPVVQMGLFLDENGIPISIESFPGNTLDHQTLRTAMKNTVDTLGSERFILIADRGMYTGTNMCHVTDHNNGYIVSKSLKKSTAGERQWLLETDGYTVVSPDFRYKSRIVDKTVTDENGMKRVLRQKVVVYWSRSFYEREVNENKSFIDFVEKLMKSPDSFRVTAAQSGSLRKFMRREFLDKETGEVVDSGKLLAMIDEDKLMEYRELMGYYQIVTSELDMPDLEIIDKYHGLTRIEDQFREMKGTLDTRPVYLSTPEHIRAHLLLCFIALTMIRVIQFGITKNLPSTSKDGGSCWSYGLTGRRVADALLSWTVDQISDEYYRMSGADNDDLSLILRSAGVNISPKLYTRGDLLAMKSAVSFL